jgi:hypothetical protein
MSIAGKFCQELCIRILPVLYELARREQHRPEAQKWKEVFVCWGRTTAACESCMLLAHNMLLRCIAAAWSQCYKIWVTHMDDCVCGGWALRPCPQVCQHLPRIQHVVLHERHEPCQT